MSICQLQTRLLGGKPFTLVITYPHARHSGIYSRTLQFMDGGFSCQTYYFDDCGSDRNFYVLQSVSPPKSFTSNKVEKIFADYRHKSRVKFVDSVEENCLKSVFKEHINHFYHYKIDVYYFGEEL